jgi:hypothetical protein
MPWKYTGNQVVYWKIFFFPFLSEQTKSSALRSKESKRMLTIYFMRKAMIKAKIPFN